MERTIEQIVQEVADWSATTFPDDLLEDTPEHRLDNYQHFLGRIADAAGCTGSPTLDEVLSRVAKLRNYAEKNAGQDWRGPEPSHIRDAKEALGWRR